MMPTLKYFANGRNCEISLDDLRAAAKQLATDTRIPNIEFPAQQQPALAPMNQKTAVELPNPKNRKESVPFMQFGSGKPEITAEGRALIKQIEAGEVQRYTQRNFIDSIADKMRHNTKKGEEAKALGWLKRDFTAYAHFVMLAIGNSGTNNELQVALRDSFGQNFENICAWMCEHGFAEDAKHLTAEIFRTATEYCHDFEDRLKSYLGDAVVETGLPDNWHEIFANEIADVREETDIAGRTARLNEEMAALETAGETRFKERKKLIETNKAGANDAAIAKLEAEQKEASTRIVAIGTELEEIETITPEAIEGKWEDAYYDICELVGSRLYAVLIDQGCTAEEFKTQFEKELTRFAPGRSGEALRHVAEHFLRDDVIATLHGHAQPYYDCRRTLIENASGVVLDLALLASKQEELSRRDTQPGAVEIPSGMYGYTPPGGAIGTANLSDSALVILQDRHSKTENLAMNIYAPNNPPSDIPDMIYDYRNEVASEASRTGTYSPSKQYAVSIFALPYDIDVAFDTYERLIGHGVSDTEFSDRIKKINREEENICIAVRSLIHTMQGIAQAGYTVAGSIIGEPALPGTVCATPGKDIKLAFKPAEKAHPLTRLTVATDESVIDLRSVSPRTLDAKGMPEVTVNFLDVINRTMYCAGESQHQYRPQLVYDTQNGFLPYPLLSALMGGTLYMLQTHSVASTAHSVIKNEPSLKHIHHMAAHGIAFYEGFYALPKHMAAHHEFPGQKPGKLEVEFAAKIQPGNPGADFHDAQGCYAKLRSNPVAFSIGEKKERERDVNAATASLFDEMISTEAGKGLILYSQSTNSFALSRDSINTAQARDIVLAQAYLNAAARCAMIRRAATAVPAPAEPRIILPSETGGSSPESRIITPGQESIFSGTVRKPGKAGPDILIGGIKW